MMQTEGKHPGGRPPKFTSAEELEEKIQEFFSKTKAANEPVTITGLALDLGFESRQSFYDYEKNEEFSYIIKKARLKVESEYEKKLSSQSVTGSIFALKNMGWKDRTEQDITSGGEKMNTIQVEVIRKNADSSNQSGL